MENKILHIQKFKNYIFYLLIGCIFVIGIILRVKMYLSSGVLEDDECRLAYSMMTDSYLAMFGPLGPWSSSPVFMFVSKIIAELCDFREYALEFLPCVFSIISIFVFYAVSKQFFQRKIIIIFANYFFAVNLISLYFSGTFKQYSFDLLLCLVCLYYFSKIDLAKITYKQAAVLSGVIAFLPLCSLPSLFYIGAFYVVNWIKNIKNKDVYKKFAIITIPILIVMTVFYIFNLAPTKMYQMEFYGDMWTEFYDLNLLKVVYQNFVYFFTPNKVPFLMLFLVLCSYVLFLFGNINRKNIDGNVMLVFLFVLIASGLNIYPYMFRAALHVIPILILLILKPIDVLGAKKVQLYFLAIFTFICFSGYFTPKFLINAYNISDKYISYSPDKLIQVIKKDFDYKNDAIIINQASTFSFTYYIRKNDFLEAERKVLTIVYKKGDTEKNVYDFLNKLDPKYNYWFYLIKEYKQLDRYYTQKWLEHQNIKFKMKDKNSYVYYIVPPYKKVYPQ